MIVLFLNHKIQSCGVYQYGLRLFNILNKSQDTSYIYTEIDDYNEYANVINNLSYNLIMYNYHISTMYWLNKNNIQKKVTNIGIPHESDNDMFDVIFNIDPNEIETYNAFSIPRPIYENVENIIANCKIQNSLIYDFINYNEGSDIPIFGSFGFGFHNKGFDKIIKYINSQYDCAIIKLVITLAHFDSNNYSNVNNIVQICNSIVRKPNIKLMISNEFFTNEEILLFLHSNTCNIFLYDLMQGRSISSVIDYAISVNKPFVISDSYMFRHVYSDNICVYKTDIKTAIENSKKMLPALLTKYSNINMINKIDNVIILYKTESLINYTIFDYQVSAYYHIQNYTENANITAKIVQLFDDYKNNNIDTFIVSNDIFSDTCFGHIKCLFINININNKIYELKFEEHQEVSWNDIFNTINAYLIDNNTQYLIQVSMGEIIDKYSILEIKCKYISDKLKLQDINKEMDILEKHVTDIKTSHFYKMLRHINEQIWLDTDIIKGLNIDNKDQQSIYNFAITSKQIFDNNQRRFRLKNYFNILKKSNIKEHKSYITDSCFIAITEENDIYHKIPEINYLCISYDAIYFNNSYKNTICKLFKNPNIYFVEDDIIEQAFVNKYTLQTYSIDAELRPKFDFTPIKYKSGGKFGDFLNQLSVICEKFYETGQKGELYIYNLKYECEQFAFGLDNTYNDTYDIISSQNYIKTYKIYNNESIDINLSSWREKLVLSHWGDIYKLSYDVSWGSHKWLNINFIDDRWSNKILINITPFRFLSKNAFLKMQNHIALQLSDCIFISNEIDYYDFFCNNTGLKIDYYQPKNFVETVAIINSCKLGYFGFSSMAVIANSLHKPHYLIGIANNDFILNNMKIYMPHVIDILV
jgi:hypothetical protein